MNLVTGIQAMSDTSLQEQQKYEATRLYYRMFNNDLACKQVYDRNRDRLNQMRQAKGGAWLLPADYDGLFGELEKCMRTDSLPYPEFISDLTSMFHGCQWS